MNGIVHPESIMKMSGLARPASSADESIEIEIRPARPRLEVARQDLDLDRLVETRVVQALSEGVRDAPHSASIVIWIGPSPPPPPPPPEQPASPTAAPVAPVTSKNCRRDTPTRPLSRSDSLSTITPVVTKYTRI